MQLQPQVKLRTALHLYCPKSHVICAVLKADVEQKTKGRAGSTKAVKRKSDTPEKPSKAQKVSNDISRVDVEEREMSDMSHMGADPVYSMSDSAPNPL